MKHKFYQKKKLRNMIGEASTRLAQEEYGKQIIIQYVG